MHMSTKRLISRCLQKHDSSIRFTSPRFIYRIHVDVFMIFYQASLHGSTTQLSCCRSEWQDIFFPGNASKIFVCYSIVLVFIPAYVLNKLLNLSFNLFSHVFSDLGCHYCLSVCVCIPVYFSIFALGASMCQQH